MRVSLEGQGPPIPEVALPAPGEALGSFSQSFILEDGVDFVKAPYVDLGYTNFEVWCVGGAGGQGGGILRSFDPFNRQSIWGGAGGGGGLHRAVGLLADLSDNVAVDVGQSGAHGQEGVPDEYPMLSSALDDPNPDWVEPLVGEDGGTSSFGDICQASGGKGGSPIRLATSDWADHYYGPTMITDLIGGDGGDGGVGNSDIAGGGGDGGSIEYTPSPFAPNIYTQAKDGTWAIPIGKGGGGGFGGHYKAVISSSPTVYGHLDAGNGGRGAFSFADTSIYGPGQRAAVEPPSGAPGDLGSNGFPTVPGGGGGAKANKLLKYGSHAPGFSPNGVVFIRLYKIA